MAADNFSNVATQASQAECDLVPLHSRERRHLYYISPISSKLAPKQSRGINGTTGKRKNMYISFWS